MKTKNKSKKKTIKENHTKKQWQLLATRMYRRNLKNDLVIRQLAEDITQKNFTIKKLEKNYEELFNEFTKKLDEYTFANKELAKKNNEVVRAYNGLAELGKFAEEQGIDIKKHSRELPENWKDYKLSQKHTLLESGKVRHEWSLTPPKFVKKKPRTKTKKGEMFYGKPREEDPKDDDK